MRLKTALVLLLLFGTTLLYAKPKSIIRWPAEHIDLNLTFDVENNRVEGIAKITVPLKGAKHAGFMLHKKFKVKWAKFAGERVQLERDNLYDGPEVSPLYGAYGKWENRNLNLWSVKIPKFAQKAAKNAGEFVITAKFSGKLYAPPDSRQFSREKIAAEVMGTIGPEGIYLSPSAFWYPQVPDSPCPTKVTATLPKGWSFVTTGVSHEQKNSDTSTEMTYTSKSPVEGIYIAAGPYVVGGEKFKGVELVTCFLPEQQDLSEGYLDACKNYVSMYDKILGSYPFEAFVVVDNFLPSGYGMPGWTLLGSEVIRLPFIKSISLGHEYVHNWFGNSMYVDYREGNWCEGLTVYLSDYKYKADKDSASAAEYRRGALMDYASYVSPENDYPVSEFISRSNSADRAIGYGKVMMIFHMLRWMCELQSPDLFMNIIKDTYSEYKWQPVSWTEWRKSFEKDMRNKLDWYQKQWIEQPGAPKLSIDNVEVADDPNYYYWTAVMDVSSVSPEGQRPYQFWLPVVAKMKDGGKVETATFIERGQQQVRIDGPGELATIHLDPSFNVFRHIYQDEMPLTLSKFMGDKKGLLVIPSGGRTEAWRKVAEGLKSEDQEVITDDQWSSKHKKRSAWLFGGPTENRVWIELLTQAGNFAYRTKITELLGDNGIEGIGIDTLKFKGKALTATLVTEHPKESSECMIFTLSLPDADVIGGTRKLPHYGKYSMMIFDGDKNIHKEISQVSAANPMMWVAPKK